GARASGPRPPEATALPPPAPPRGAEISVSEPQRVDPRPAEPTRVEAPAGEAPAPGGPTEQPAGHEEGGDSSVEHREAEEAIAQQTKALLTSVLDRLGAAHHRPFSRA